MVRCADRKNVVAYLGATYQVSVTRACKTISFSKSLYYYRSCKDDKAVIEKLGELAEKNPREGQDKYYSRIRLEGIKWNYKRVRRVYKLMGLNHRRRTKKRVPAQVKEPLVQTKALNQTWSMDFMHDTLVNKRKFRTLNIIDDFNRKALHVEAEFSFSSSAVTGLLQRTIHEHGKPARIRVDNGPEFTSKEFMDWCRNQGIIIHHIQPGKPVQNAYIERFNRTYRENVLDAYLFENLFQVRTITENWMYDYNFNRPHEALNEFSPMKYQELYNFEKLV